MTASALLELTELAACADVPADRLRHYAEVGLLPPASRDGARFGYPAGEVEFVRLLTGVEQLGVTAEDLSGIAAAWHAGDCAGAQRQLIATLTGRLNAVQADLAAYGRQAVDLGPGTAGWADATRASVAVYEDAARLQAVIAALAGTPHAGPCGDGCGCRAALTAPGIAYQFPVIDDGPALACDLAADGGDVHDRISVWQQVLARVQRRDPVSDTDVGVALRFPLDADLAAILARLVAAEYRCCAFGSYTIAIDHTGLRLEVRMPTEAAGQLAAVFGRARPTGRSREGGQRCSTSAVRTCRPYSTPAP
jgi:DNA-binding transcriptional MerR regulator